MKTIIATTIILLTAVPCLKAMDPDDPNYYYKTSHSLTIEVNGEWRIRAYLTECDRLRMQQDPHYHQTKDVLKELYYYYKKEESNVYTNRPKNPMPLKESVALLQTALTAFQKDFKQNAPAWFANKQLNFDHVKEIIHRSSAILIYAEEELWKKWSDDCNKRLFPKTPTDFENLCDDIFGIMAGKKEELQHFRDCELM